MAQTTNIVNAFMKPVSDSFNALLKTNKSVVFVLVAVAILTFVLGYVCARPRPLRDSPSPLHKATL